ncbi:MAG: hypothetical protein AB7E60_02040 [Sphingobium sp.]
MKTTTTAAALLLAALGTAAHAEGIGAEANYGRANGHWGTEIGAGYALDLAGFRLAPSGGIYLRDGDTAFYGRVEGSVALPMAWRIGAGIRISGDDPRPYATVAMPIIPKLAAKANAGPKYVSLGVTLGY